MDWLLPLLIGLLLGSVLGAAVAFLLAKLRQQPSASAQTSEELAVARAQVQERENRVAELQTDLTHSREEASTLRRDAEALRLEQTKLEAARDAENKALSEKLALLDKAQTQLADTFKALSSEALAVNNKRFLEMAKGDLDQRQKTIQELVKPLNESLKNVNKEVLAAEKARAEGQAALGQQIRSLLESQQKLQTETNNLSNALHKSHVRGRWGEFQLRNVVEAAGMRGYCDFIEQASTDADSGVLRPDMIVRLPGGKQIVIDAKTPIDAYIDAVGVEDEQARAELLRKHAQQVRDQVQKLSSKQYWSQFEGSPDFVIMFLPGETFFSAALDANPNLIADAVAQKVIPASPTTLIALLKAVHYGWQQERVAENAQQISELGRELYDRLATMAGHFVKLGNNLDKSVHAYNRAMNSFDSRALVTMRKFAELGAEGKNKLETISPIESITREPPAIESGAPLLPSTADEPEETT